MRPEDTDGSLEAKRVEVARAANKTRTPFMLKPTEGWNRFSLDAFRGVNAETFINVRYHNGRMYCTRIKDALSALYRDEIAEWQFVQPVYVRWRAERGEPYHSVSIGGGVITHAETGSEADDKRYRLGNYFKAVEDATECDRRILNVIEAIHMETV